MPSTISVCLLILAMIGVLAVWRRKRLQWWEELLYSFAALTCAIAIWSRLPLLIGQPELTLRALTPLDVAAGIAVFVAATIHASLRLEVAALPLTDAIRRRVERMYTARDWYAGLVGYLLTISTVEAAVQAAGATSAGPAEVCKAAILLIAVRYIGVNAKRTWA